MSHPTDKITQAPSKETKIVKKVLLAKNSAEANTSTHSTVNPSQNRFYQLSRLITQAINWFTNPPLLLQPTNHIPKEWYPRLYYSTQQSYSHHLQSHATKAICITRLPFIQNTNNNTTTIYWRKHSMPYISNILYYYHDILYKLNTLYEYINAQNDYSNPSYRLNYKYWDIYYTIFPSYIYTCMSISPYCCILQYVTMVTTYGNNIDCIISKYIMKQLIKLPQYIMLLSTHCTCHLFSETTISCSNLGYGNDLQCRCSSRQNQLLVLQYDAIINCIRRGIYEYYMDSLHIYNDLKDVATKCLGILSIQQHKSAQTLYQQYNIPNDD